ncbi:MAG: UDPGP type 1 family protein [Sedimentisphaerales bacterium]|nr:UDPGP type 1 family protein [Sedimentisphaerales bacterium]
MAQTFKSRIDAATRELRNHNQEHVLQFVEQLDRSQREILLDDLEQLDLNLLDRLIEEHIHNPQPFELPKRIDPPQVYPAKPASDLESKYRQALDRGENLIAEHKVAAFTVAGGQGTRLNFDGPKGNVPATPVRNKTLFRLFAETVLAVQRKYNCVLPWYIMTSRANHEDTVRTFEQNDHFGLNPGDVFFFRQGMMPCVDTEGKLMLASPESLAMNPDGHGGSLRALFRSGAIEDMARRGVEYISYFQIDNPLVYVVDPLFIGLHALDNADMSSKAVVKAEPLEKVGNFALVDNKVTVIEYSDLPDDLAYKKRSNGRLMLEYGSIAIHVISRSFVEKLNQHGFSLPWHRAFKKVPYIDKTAHLVSPENPNAYKFESFVFDALRLADHSIILEIERADQFAPIKNASGVDSLQSSQQLQIERAARWMERAGIKVPRREDGTVDALIEISPLFALDDHELYDKRRQLREMKAGDIVYLG